MRRNKLLPATTDAVAWTFFEADDFDCPRIDVTFDAAPTSAGLLTLTRDNVAGEAYDAIIRSVDPRGLTSLSLSGIHGLVNGDKLVLTYANPDGVEVSASAALELPLPLDDIDVAGLTAASGTIESKQSSYRRYYHLDTNSADPGASGANYEVATANYLAGLRLDASTDTARAEFDVHSDWDTSQNPVLDATVTVMEAGTDAADIIKFKIVVSYAQPGTAVRSQTLYAEATVGLIAQYTMLHFTKEVDRAAADNVLLQGDVINIVVNVEADSDIGDVVINSAAFYYPTTHVGVESGDT